MSSYHEEQLIRKQIEVAEEQAKFYKNLNDRIMPSVVNLLAALTRKLIP